MKEEERPVFKVPQGEETGEAGEGAGTDSETLRGWIGAEKAAARRCRSLAARLGGPDGRLLRKIAERFSEASRMLEAVYFLWTGIAAGVPDAPPQPKSAAPAALRELCRGAQRRSAACRQAAEELPAYRTVLQEVSAREARCAAQLCRLLQRYVPRRP